MNASVPIGSRVAPPPPPSGRDPRRHQHWDVQRFFSNYSFLILGNGLNLIFSFLNIWLATHALGAPGYGELAAVIAAGQAVLMLTVNWTATALFRFGASEFVEQGTLAAAFWSRAIILAANLGLLLATYPLWSSLLLTRYHLTRANSWLLGAFILSSVLTVQVQYSFQAAKRPKNSAVVLLAERVMVSAGLVVIVKLQAASLTTVMAAYVTGGVLAAIAGIVSLRRFLRPVSLPLGTVRKMIAFSAPLATNGFVGYFSSNFVDAFFLLKYLSFASLGVYAVGFQFAGVLMQVPTLAGTLLLPFFVTQLALDRDDRVQRYFAHALPVVTLAWSVMCVLAGAIGTQVVPRILGAPFHEVAKVIWPLALASAIAGPVLFGLGALSSAQGATARSAFASIAAAIANVSLDALWIPRYGVEGCGWATAAAYSASLAVWLILSRRYCRPGVILAGTIPLAVSAAGLLLGATNATVVIGAVASAVVVLVLRRSRLSDDMQMLREAWTRASA